MEMDHSAHTNMGKTTAPAQESMSMGHTMGVMGTTFNFDTAGFSILFEKWAIENVGQLIGSMILLFFVSFGTSLLTRYKFKKYFNRYSDAAVATIAAFLGALLMLAMMTFNFFVILAIVLGTGAAHAVIPPKKQDMEPYLCH